MKRSFEESFGKTNETTCINTKICLFEENLQGERMEIEQSFGIHDSLLNSAEFLQKVTCGFVKRPGKTYHLYEKTAENYYFSMLSPEEWKIVPHKYIGSWTFFDEFTWIKS